MVIQIPGQMMQVETVVRLVQRPWEARWMDARHSEDHERHTFQRWKRLRNRVQGDTAYRNDWYAQQCGGCQYWVPLAGTWGADFGACSNEESPFDSTVRFEHDGCEFFLPAEKWGIPDDFDSGR